MEPERDYGDRRSGLKMGWRAWRDRRRHSRRHRILIIVENCSVPRDRRVWKECRSLVQAGFEVSVIAPREPGEPRREVVDGIDLLRYRPTRERRAKLGFLVEFANAELAATGAHARTIVLSGLESLTASERRAAHMAAQGLSNKEIAQALFVTVKTVEQHLGRVYRKLDISSRRQLGAALRGPADAPTPA